MLANCAKAQPQLHASYERQFKHQEACVRVMRGLVGEASGIGDDLNDLAGLFDMALHSDGVDGKPAEAIRLVVGSMKTMADRLYALEEQGYAARARYFQ